MYVIENKSNPHIQSQKITKWNHLFLRDKVYLHTDIQYALDHIMLV